MVRRHRANNAIFAPVTFSARTFVLLLPVLASLVASDLAWAWSWDLQRHGLEIGATQRRFLVYAPPDAETLPGQRPLVIVLHGGGGTDRGMARLTKRRFQDLADRDGFYVVYPDALTKMWDFGAGDVSESLERRVDDRAFFEQLLDFMLENYPVDADRIFATGISRGGQASYFLACQFPGRIRAIAPVTMPLPAFMEDDCRAGPPVGVAIINGTDDPLVPFDGGQIRVFDKERGAVLSTAETMTLWLRRNGCLAQPSDQTRIDTHDDGMAVVRTRWMDCKGAPVVLFRVEGGGHTWPSGRQYLPAFLVGPVNRDIDAAAEIWAFFRTFDP